MNENTILPMKLSIKSDVNRYIHNIIFIEDSIQTNVNNKHMTSHVNNDIIKPIPLTRQKASSKEDIEKMKYFADVHE